MVMMLHRRGLVARAPVAEIMPFQDAGVLEQLHGPVHGGERDVGIERDGAAVQLLDVGMVARGREHACDDAALAGHAQTPAGAVLLDARGTFRHAGRHSG